MICGSGLLLNGRFLTSRSVSSPSSNLARECHCRLVAIATKGCNNFDFGL